VYAPHFVLKGWVMEEYKLVVTTQFSESKIEQFESVELDIFLNKTVSRIMDLRDAGVREALVTLGWTPPNMCVAMEPLPTIQDVATKIEVIQSAYSDNQTERMAAVALVLQQWYESKLKPVIEGLRYYADDGLFGDKARQALHDYEKGV